MTAVKEMVEKKKRKVSEMQRYIYTSAPQTQLTHGTTNLKDTDKNIGPLNRKRGQHRNDLNIRQTDRFGTVGRINFSFVRQRDKHIHEQSRNARKNTGDRNGVVCGRGGALIAFVTQPTVGKPVCTRRTQETPVLVGL